MFWHSQQHAQSKFMDGKSKSRKCLKFEWFTRGYPVREKVLKWRGEERVHITDGLELQNYNILFKVEH